MSVDTGALSEFEVKIPITPPSRYEALETLESELESLLWKAIALVPTRMPRSVIHPTGWLHSMMLQQCDVCVAASSWMPDDCPQK